MNPYPANVTPMATAKARDVAVWLIGEAHAHRMPPVVSVEAVDCEVVLTLQPTAGWQWDVWANLLHTETRRTAWSRDLTEVTAHGSWDGTHVILTGLEPEKWVAR